MAGDDDRRLVDEAFADIESHDRERPEQADEAERRRAADEVAARVEDPGLQERIIERYLGYGRELLADQLPTRLDPRIAKRLEPLIGDVSRVQVHTGPMATAAAEAFGARAFAIGDEDIFVAEGQYDPTSSSGAALLAHEAAHARDASTGFALAADTAGGATEHERYAERIERVFAQEDLLSAELREELEEQPAGRSGGAPAGGAAKAALDGIDRVELERRVWQLLEKQTSRRHERTGG